MKTIKNGSYNDPSVWDGSGGDREIYHHVWLDQDAQSNERIFVAATGKFEWRGARLTMNNKNFVYEGELYSRPVPGKRSGLRFTNIDERLVQGSGMVEMPTDIGLWGFMRGKINIEGTYKTPYTYVTGNARKGETFVNVLNADGWKVGDEIVVGTMDDPTGNDPGWDSRDEFFTDPFFTKFERRVITSINGRTITFTGGLLHDHMMVTTGYGVTHTCPVVNLTRDFVIEGTPQGKAHCFHTAHNRQGQHAQHDNVSHNIKNIEGRFLGQRHPGHRGGQIASGRYAMHFHHNGNGTTGTVIENCSYHDIGNRCYVPHMSNGITYKNNTVFDCVHIGFWWDDRENSHFITWDGNLIICRPGPDGFPGEGMLLGMGDGNVARNNITYYCNGGYLHNNNGAYAWNADSEGVWTFENNKAFAAVCGLFVWQNTGNNHTIVRYEGVNSSEAVQHGAYINAYIYVDCKFHRAPVFVEASSGNEHGVVWDNCIFDAGGKPYGVTGVDSPAGSHPLTTNKFLRSKFMGHTIAGIKFKSDLPFSNPEKQIKNFDIVECEHTGELFNIVHNDPEPLKDGWRIRVQPKTGQPYQVRRINQQDVRENIAEFSPRIWGTGTGLKGEYYLGSNFETKKFERVDSMVMFQGWSPDPKYAAFGVHHLVQGDLYSMRWTGKIQPQYTGAYVFPIESWGGIRLWVNNVLILDVWQEFHDRAFRYSAPIILTANQLYDIKIEHNNSSGSRGCMLYWKHQNMLSEQIVPMTQLYPGIAAPPPPTFSSAQKSQSFTRNNCGAGFTGGAHMYTVPANKYTSTISQADADAKAQAEIDANGQNAANQNATCTQINQPPPMPIVANAGADKIVASGQNSTLDASASTGPITSYRWYHNSGPGFNIVDEHAAVTPINFMVNGVHEFLLVVKDAAGNQSSDSIKVTVQAAPVFKNVRKEAVFTRNNCGVNATGSQYTYGVAPGVYEASTQAAADQLALNDIAANGQAAANQHGTCTVIRTLKHTIKVYDNGDIETS